MNIITKILSAPLPSKEITRNLSNMQKIAYDFSRLNAQQIEVIPQTNVKNSATFIFFHGSGECLFVLWCVFFTFFERFNEMDR